MFRRTRSLFLLALSILLVSATAQATVIHDEGISGDLSDDPAAPTAVAFGFGSNQVIGTTTTSGVADTRDYFTFTIGAGLSLARIILDVHAPADTTFQALSSGATSFIPGSGTAGSFLGSSHLNGGLVGTDALDDMAALPFGGIGFSIPLAPGTYTYLIQQTGAEVTSYSLDFQLIPEPSTAMLIAAGLLGLGYRRRFGR